MPLDTQPDWGAQLRRMEAEAAGETDYYTAGWHACMAWDEIDPPPHLSADDAAQWRAGWWAAYDAPLGSACDEFDRECGR